MKILLALILLLVFSSVTAMPSLVYQSNKVNRTEWKNYLTFYEPFLKQANIKKIIIRDYPSNSVYCGFNDLMGTIVLNDKSFRILHCDKEITLKHEICHSLLHHSLNRKTTKDIGLMQTQAENCAINKTIWREIEAIEFLKEFSKKFYSRYNDTISRRYLNETD